MSPEAYTRLISLYNQAQSGLDSRPLDQRLAEARELIAKLTTRASRT